MGFTTNRQVAVELLSSSVCNAACSYCFIPKVPSLKELLPKIKGKLCPDGYIKEMKELFGDKLEALGLWGTEPLTTLKDWNDILPQILNEFPNLNNLSFSTNLFLNPKIIVDFINHLPKDRKKLRLTIQISIDGPPEITDENRGVGGTKKIVDHFIELLDDLSTIDLGELHINFSFKPTLDMKNIEWFLESISRLYGYFFFFDILIGRAFQHNKNKNVRLHLSGLPTLAMPGFFTTEDGIKASKFFRQLKDIELNNKNRNIFEYIKGGLNSYEDRYKSLFRFGSEYNEKSCMFTCSAGDSNFQLDCNDNIHICHRTLFYENEEFLNTLIKDEYIQSRSEYTSRGMIKNIKKNWIVKRDNQAEINRFLYIAGNYHNNGNLRTHLNLPTIYELAYSGQISKCYLDETMASAFSLFCHTAMSCPAESLLNNGSIYLPVISVLRFFGNGAFEDIFKNVIEETKGEYIR
jgi:sulfatase maturation enzyme AslB (radical SAM superfamily)